MNCYVMTATNFILINRFQIEIFITGEFIQINNPQYLYPFPKDIKRHITEENIFINQIKSKGTNFQVLNKYNFTYQETDETGWNYNTTVGDCVFSELRQFYELKCYNDQGEYIPTANMKDFVCKNSPFKVFDIIESFSHHYEDKFISEINTILSLNEIPFYLSKEEGIVSSYDLKLDGKLSVAYMR